MSKLVAVLTALLIFVGMTLPALPVAASAQSSQPYTIASVDDKKPRDPGAKGKRKGQVTAPGKVKKRPQISPRKATRPGRNNPATNRRPVRPINITVKCGPTTVSAGQGRVICVTIEQPVETHTIYRTRTKTQTEKVLQGAGVLALVAVGAGLLALFLGYVLGWRGAGKNESKFYSSLLDDNKK